MNFRAPATHLVDLPNDHPGFADPAYRARRNAIAALETDVRYTRAEHALWRTIATNLAPLHERFACRALHAGSAFALPRHRIPSLSEINEALRDRTGFRLRPVAGLVPSRQFFAALADGVFLSTQYIRHASRPDYTPEPDIVHELWGHAASLAHPAIADLNRAMGRASLGAPESILIKIERLYWFGLEFGLVIEDGEPRAFGAGLLSSASEIERACSGQVPLRPFSAANVGATAFSTDAMQPALFVADSVDALVRTVHAAIKA